MHQKTVAVVALIGMAFVSAPALAGPEWVEQADAGGKYSTAQRTFGSGPLNAISGTLETSIDGVPDYEDMFLIAITDPALFTMSVSAAFSAQIFVFNITLPGEAFGLLGNAGTPPAMGSAANDGTGAQINLPGVYAIAISVLGRNPISINGLIYNFAVPGEVSGADGPGGVNPHTDWVGSGIGGEYVIHLTGATFYDLPSPGALALLGVAGLVGSRSRRRH